MIHFNRVFRYKPSILGYPYFWKHPHAKHDPLWYTHSFVHLRMEFFQNHHLTNTLPIQQKHEDPPMDGWPGLHWNRLGLSHQTWLPRSASDKRISGVGGTDLAWWYGKIIGKVNHHRSMAFFFVDCGQILDRSLSSLEIFLFEWGVCRGTHRIQKVDGSL